MGDYRKLEVWRLSCSVADRVDTLVDGLPSRLKDGIGDQLARAAESIHLNIAEGCGLNSDAQLARHLRIALGSANELEDGLASLHRRELLLGEHANLLDDAGILRRQLGAFLKRITSARAVSH